MMSRPDDLPVHDDQATPVTRQESLEQGVVKDLADWNK